MKIAFIRISVDFRRFANVTAKVNFNEKLTVWLVDDAEKINLISFRLCVIKSHKFSLKYVKPIILIFISSLTLGKWKCNNNLYALTGRRREFQCLILYSTSSPTLSSSLFDNVAGSPEFFSRDARAFSLLSADNSNFHRCDTYIFSSPANIWYYTENFACRRHNFTFFFAGFHWYSFSGWLFVFFLNSCKVCVWCQNILWNSFWCIQLVSLVQEISWH